MTNESHDDPLRQRVSDLEREVGALRRRVTQLEHGIGVVTPAPAPAATFVPPPVVAPVAATAPVVAPSPAPKPVAMPPPLPAVATPVATVSVPVHPLPAPVYRAPVAPPPPPPPTSPLVPEGPSPFRLFLERLQLWPPSGEGNSEARLGAWWATRLGTMFTVIAVVFLGVYVSRNTPSWVRFVELLGASIGLSALGLWLERKIEKFGAVLFGGGLALLYFCAYAAYAIAPVKVIDSAVVAALWQFSAVLVLSVAAVWRRSSVVATMAVALGFVTAVFSRTGAMDAFALGSTLMLGVAAVFFHRRWKWEGPAFLAMPGTYVIYALLFLAAQRVMPGVAQWWEWPVLGGALVLFFLRDWRGKRVEAGEVGWSETTFQGLNSSLAAAVGVMTALVHYRAELVWFYFSAAAIFTLFAWIRHRQVEGDAMSAVFLAKASGALTLGVVELMDGRTTAIALLVQAWVMLAVASRLRSRVMSAGTVVVAVVACGFMLRDVEASVAMFSLEAAGQAAFVVGLALLGTEMARRLGWTGSDEARRLFEGAVAIAAGVLGLLAVESWLPAEWRPAMLMAVVGLLVIAAAGRRAWGPAAAAIVPLAAANFALWSQAWSGPAGAVLWWNALAVLAPVITGGAVAGNYRVTGLLQAMTQTAQAMGAILWGVALIGLELVLFNAWSGATALAATALLVLGLRVLEWRWADRSLSWLATFAAGVAVALWLRGHAAMVPTAAAVIAAALLWMATIASQVRATLVPTAKTVRGAGWQQGLLAAAATIVTFRALEWGFTGPAESLAFAVAAFAVGALVLWPGVARAVEASWVLWLGAGISVYGLAEPTVTSDLARYAVVGLLAWVPVVIVARAPRILAWWSDGQTWWRIVGPVHALLAVWITVKTAESAGGFDVRLWWLVAGVGCALVAGGWSRALPARVASVALTAWAGWRGLAAVESGATDEWDVALAGVLGVVALAIVLPLLVAKGEGTFSVATQRHLHRWIPAGGMALAFLALASQDGELRPFATVGWGVVACAVFLMGMVARSRPHRLLGLIGLALCVPRVFLVDLNSTLHRIIAFVVLGAVLLGVGFSYQKFRHWIVEDGSDKDAGEPEAKS